MRILFADGLSDTAVEWLRAGGHTGTLKPSLTGGGTGTLKPSLTGGGTGTLKDYLTGGGTGTLKPSLTADEPREELLDAVRAWSDGIQASNLHA